MKNRVDELIEILFDESAREDERHDAAIYLFDFDDPQALNAFFKIGENKNQLHILLEAAGEGIGEIWSRNNQINLKKLDKLTRISRNVALSIIRSKNPKLLMKLQ
jgi:hypothetical protein